MFLIPFQVLLLILLAFGFARKQVHQVITLIINFSVNVNNIRIKLFPFLALINAFAMAFLYFSIAEL